MSITGQSPFGSPLSREICLTQRPCCSITAGKNTKDDDVCYRVTADTIRTVDTTNHLTCRPRSLNRLFMRIQYRSIAIDGYPAHGVMHPGSNADRKKGALTEWMAQRSLTSKVIITLLADKPIITCQRANVLCSVS